MTTDHRQARTASDLLRFLPLALIITMFGVAVLIGLVSTSRVSSGIYHVIAGEGSGEFILAFTPAATASAAMGAWQYQLGGAGGHGRTRRGVYAIGAAIVAALYTASYVFALFIGFD